MDLTQKHCKPCEGVVKPFTPDQIEKYNSALTTVWEVIDNKKISRNFTFKNFKQAIAFVNKVADIAESESHHPDIHISYNRVTLILWTHAIGGLSINDFILAAKLR